MARITRRIFLALAAAAAAPFKYLAELAGDPDDYSAEIEAAMGMVEDGMSFERQALMVAELDRLLGVPELVEAETTYTARFQDGSSRTEKERWEFRVDLETLEVVVSKSEAEVLSEEPAGPREKRESLIAGVRATAAKYDDPELRKAIHEDSLGYALDCSKTVKLWGRGEAGAPPTDLEMEQIIIPALAVDRAMRERGDRSDLSKPRAYAEDPELLAKARELWERGLKGKGDNSQEPDGDA